MLDAATAADKRGTRGEGGGEVGMLIVGVLLGRRTPPNGFCGDVLIFMHNKSRILVCNAFINTFIDSSTLDNASFLRFARVCVSEMPQRVGQK